MRHHYYGCSSDSEKCDNEKGKRGAVELQLVVFLAVRDFVRGLFYVEPTSST